MELCEEEGGPSSKSGECGLLRKSMYGTRDAAQNWEETYTAALKDLGFVVGLSSPCFFYQPVRDISTSMHGDDITSLGTEEHLLW